MSDENGSKLLRQWIDGTGRKVAWVAKAIPANRSLVHQWLNGNHTPRQIYRHRIEAVTGGAVPVDSWDVDQ